MTQLKCTLCDKEYLGYDDSEAGVPNVCGDCDAEMFDNSEIDPKNPPQAMIDEFTGCEGDEDGEEQ